MDKNIKLEQKLVSSDRKNKKNVHFGNLGNKNKYNKSMTDLLNSHNKSKELLNSNDAKNNERKDIKGKGLNMNMKPLDTKDLGYNNDEDSSTNRYRLDTGRLDQEADELRQMLSD